MKPNPDSSASWFVVACGTLGLRIDAADSPRHCNHAGQANGDPGTEVPASEAPEPRRSNKVVAQSVSSLARGSVYVLTADLQLRDRLRALLRAADLEVSHFSRVEDCLRALGQNVCNCLVAVGEMPQVVEIATRQRSAPQLLGVPVVALTDANNLSAAIAAMKAGAFDVVEMPALETRLLEVVRAALNEQRLRRQQHEECMEVQRRYAALTAREREILHLVVAGLRSRAIATRLGIREKTVEVYRSRVNHKMNAHNAAELAQMLRCIEL